MRKEDEDNLLVAADPSVAVEKGERESVCAVTSERESERAKREP